VKTLVIMRGCPGSGKSYAARQLADTNPDDSIICSTDSYFVNLGGGTYKFDPSKLGLYHKANLERATGAMEMCFGLVIIDNTNIVKRDFSSYVEAGLKYGYEVQHKEPDSPWWAEIRHELPVINEQTSLLLAEEFASRTFHSVPVEAIARMLRRWENIT
jgi:NEDD4-binding protein 2